jgi:hypothetical protein
MSGGGRGAGGGRMAVYGEEEEEVAGEMSGWLVVMALG